MRSAQVDVAAFMRTGGQEVREVPSFPETSFDALVALQQIQADTLVLAKQLEGVAGILPLRARLMLEETAETIRAMADEDMIEVADGLADDLYVTIGTAAALGIDIGPIWDEVQSSNMSKFVVCEDCQGHGGPKRWGFTLHPLNDGLGAIDVIGPDGTVTHFFSLEEANKFTEKNRPRCLRCSGTGRNAIRDAQGKVLKPKTWRPPEIEGLLLKQGWRKP